MRRRIVTGFLIAAITLGLFGLVPAAAQAYAGGATVANREAHGSTTAWRGGAFRTDTEGLISRSDLVLDRPGWRPHQSMPLGNGDIGAAVWAADGFTAQLNRKDTFPQLKSAGQLVIPSLYPMARAKNYQGRLDMYDATLRQRGAGMSADTYVRADANQLVVDVDGADPRKRQTVELRLWDGREPETFAAHGVAGLAETFADEQSGMTSGALAAMTAQARDVSAKVVDDLTVRLSFRPRADGSFRVVAGVPAYDGGDVADAANKAVARGKKPNIDDAHRRWWSHFWDQVAPMRVSSPDGVGEYMENLRVQQLYTTAATQRGRIPTGQAGAANVLYSFEDQMVSPDTWFHFNLRQQVFANFGAGTAVFNRPYLRLYTDRLAQMLDWTRKNWSDTEGVCVPELLRFDGTGGACDGAAEPSFLNRIVSNGAEVAHDIWQQYRFTGDESVLDEGYPLMREVGGFYLSILEAGADGKLHLNHVNALETQWDTTDPTTDIAAMKVMFPIIAKLADDNGDTQLADRLRAAVPKLPDFRTVKREGAKVLAWSATDESAKNTQNVDLDPLMPWGLFGPDSKLIRDTFRKRVFPLTREWDESPIWAARLGLAADVRKLLVQGTRDLQKFPNGFTSHGRNDDPATIHNFYSSWNAVVAGALQEGLVQSYDGVVRVGTAVPDDWSVDGSVRLPGGHTVSTQVSDGVPNLVGIEAGSDDRLTIANPWPGQRIQIVDGDATSAEPVVEPTNSRRVTLDVEGGSSYLVERVAAPYQSFAHRPVGGQPARDVKHLGTQTLGIAASTPEIRSNLVSVAAPSKLDGLVRARDGVDHYVDTSDVISDLPKKLDGSVLVRGAQSDAGATSPADYLRLNVKHPAEVYVGMDQRGQGAWWPEWLTKRGFEKTKLEARTRSYLQHFQPRPGRLRVTGSGTALTKDGADWGDQVVDTTFQQVQIGTSFMFRAQDDRNGYVWQIGGPLGSAGGLGQLRMYTLVDGEQTLLGEINPIKPAPGNTYHVRVEAIGDRIRTFINGELVDDRTDDTFGSGRVGIRATSGEVGEYDRFSVHDPSGKALFGDDFSSGLDAWKLPADDNVPLTLWRKRVSPGQLVLGPNSGVEDQGDASYVTFVRRR